MLAAFILLLTDLVTPFSADVLVSFASAIQADLSRVPFPFNVYQSWNLRGIGYKYFMYGLYRLASLFADDQRPFLFQTVAKVLYLALVLALIWIFCRGARLALGELQVEPFDAFIVCAVAVLAVSQMCRMQSEELAVLLALGMMTASVADSKAVNYLAGIFPPLLLSCKFVTVVFALVPLAVVAYLGEPFRPKLRRVLLGSFAFGVVTLLVYRYLIPQELVDGIHATWFQSSFNFSRIAPVRGFLVGLAKAIQHAPFILVGLAFAGLVVLRRRTRTGKTIATLVALSAICIASVALQAKWFGYHYSAFLLLGFFTVLLSLAAAPQEDRRVLYRSALFATLTLWLVSVLVISREGPFRDPSANETYYKDIEYEPMLRVLRDINQRFALSREPNLLFLGDGQASFVIRCRSYSRYFFPLPLQRAKGNPSLATTDLYKQEMASILAYRGKYIYLEPRWLDLSVLRAIREKIAAEYETVADEPAGPGGEIVLLRRKDRA